MKISAKEHVFSRNDRDEHCQERNVEGMLDLRASQINTADVVTNSPEQRVRNSPFPQVWVQVQVAGEHDDVSVPWVTKDTSENANKYLQAVQVVHVQIGSAVPQRFDAGCEEIQIYSCDIHAAAEQISVVW